MTWTDELLRKIESVDNENLLFETVQHAASELGFEYCAYGMRIPVPVTKPRTVMLNNYPKAWQERYAEKKYLDIDPTILLGRQSQQPIIWNDSVFSRTPELWNDARDAGLRVGWAKSVLESQSVGGMLTLARANDPLTAKELAAKEHRMRWLANTAHQGFRRIVAARWKVPLSSREKEVLRWAADGKTFSETSEIMDISVATVKFHTRNAAEKLGTANRTATVARAVVMGLLA
ncbi:autoinducer binding domain-containing protein [Ottowia sp.]|uniref:autoinducer binding domain-containing protein n=1 Tax=Ottowia sp. TaxID=1898956 RepID=UPI00260E373F|nr:autoinducer binding domain-containing protein [Ottowia sp.]